MPSTFPFDQKALAIQIPKPRCVSFFFKSISHLSRPFKIPLSQFKTPTASEATETRESEKELDDVFLNPHLPLNFHETYPREKESHLKTQLGFQQRNFRNSTSRDFVFHFLFQVHTLPFTFHGIYFPIT
jgi:hypothetical protein